MNELSTLKGSINAVVETKTSARIAGHAGDGSAGGGPLGDHSGISLSYTSVGKIK